MAGTIETKLKSLGIELPAAPAPAANYVPFVISGNLVFVSGQISIAPGGVAYSGRLGDQLDLAAGQAAARQCALNIIAQLKAALGDLDRITRIVKLGAFVASIDNFSQQPAVVNGASDLMVEVFGDKGRHARFAVGVPVLPLGVAVEIDAVAEFV